MVTQPSLFISHGAPTLAIEPGPAQEYLRRLGQALRRPAAILVVSAHHDARGVKVTSDDFPDTMYDFGGFAEELFDIRYTAPGQPQLAKEVVSILSRLGFEANLQPDRGFDHGAWVPLHLMYPAADIPVVQVSIDMHQNARWHYDLGTSLATLREENVLIIGSGSLTHNLSAFMHKRLQIGAPREAWVSEFADWLEEKILSGDIEAVLDAVGQGPSGRRNHPTMDHILPLFVAIGAGAGSMQAAQLHSSTTYGVLAMDAFGFGPTALLESLKDGKMQNAMQSNYLIS